MSKKKRSITKHHFEYIQTGFIVFYYVLKIYYGCAVLNVI